MNENQKRPTKKQYELLRYIRDFIAEHGYGPSYREIMVGCNYSSVATVAAHIKNLETAGHLVKKGRSARSLEVVEPELPTKGKVRSNIVAPSEEKWLVDKIDYKFTLAENSNPSAKEIDELYVLVGALKVLGLEGAAQSFIARLSELKSKTKL